MLLHYNGDDSDINLPSEIDGETIVIIGGYVFRNDNTIESVSMSDDVEEISEQAFQNCTNLRSIYLSSKITELNKWLFEGCTLLTDVVLPENLVTIKYRAFGDCTSLETLEIPASVTSIDDTAFDGCTNLTMYVQAGSYAEEYANEHGIPYVSEGSVETVPPETEAPSSAPTPEQSMRPTPEETPTTAATPETTSAVSTEPIVTEPVPTEPVIPYEITDCTVKDGTAEVTVRRSSGTAAANLIFAGYNADGSLVSIESAAVPDAAEFKKAFECTGEYFKIYIWNINTLHPFTDVYEMSY